MVCQEILRFSKYVLGEPESEDCVCMCVCGFKHSFGVPLQAYVSRSPGMWLRSLHLHSELFLQRTYMPSYRT